MKTVSERNAVWVGIGLGFFGMAILLPILLYMPSLGQLFERNLIWLRFGVYTATVFAVLAKWFRPWDAQAKFWGLLLGLLMLHTAALVLLMRKGAPLTSAVYIVFGPFEMIILGLALQPGMRALGIREEE